MSEAATGPIRTTLIDIANCIGCRACRGLQAMERADGEQTELESDLGFQNPATLSAKTYTLIAFHEMENGEAGRRGIRVRDAAVPPLPGAGLRLRLPDDGAHRQADGPVSHDVDKCIGCRYCSWRVPGTCRPRNGTRAPRRSRSARTAPTASSSRRRSRSTGARPSTRQAVRRKHRDSRLRQGVPRRRPALRNPGRCWRSRTSASPTGPTATSTTSTERRSWAERACSICRSAVRETRLPDVREKPFPAFTQRRSAPFPRRDRRRHARRRARLLPKRAQKVADASKHSGDHGHVEFEPLRPS